MAVVQIPTPSEQDRDNADNMRFKQEDYQRLWMESQLSDNYTYELWNTNYFYDYRRSWRNNKEIWVRLIKLKCVNPNSEQPVYLNPYIISAKIFNLDSKTYACSHGLINTEFIQAINNQDTTYKEASEIFASIVNNRQFTCTTEHIRTRIYSNNQTFETNKRLFNLNYVGVSSHNIGFNDSLLETIIKSYSIYYIQKFGVDKYNKIMDKVRTSDKLAKLDGKSLQLRVAPTSHDFLTTINSIFYFITAGQETCAMGGLLALSLWDMKINKIYQFATPLEMRDKALAMFEILKLNY